MRHVEIFSLRLWPIEKLPVGHFQLMRDNLQVSFFVFVTFRNILPQKIILSAYLMVLFSASEDKTLSLFTSIKNSKQGSYTLGPFGGEKVENPLVMCA